MLFGAEATKLLTHRQQQLLLGMMGRLSPGAEHQCSSVVYSTSHSNTSHLLYVFPAEMERKQKNADRRTDQTVSKHDVSSIRGFDASFGAALTDEASAKID